MRIAPAVTCLALALLQHLPAATSACADSQLRLNEIMAGPARDWDNSGTFSSRDDEWVEVANTGAAPLDLSSFLITDGDTIPRYALSGTLAAGAKLVIYGKTSWDWERATPAPAGLDLLHFLVQSTCRFGGGTPERAVEICSERSAAGMISCASDTS